MSQHTILASVNMVLTVPMHLSSAKFHVDEMTQEDIYRLGRVPCAFMLYTYDPHNDDLQTVHGIILWTGNPCDVPLIHGHSHFTSYPTHEGELNHVLRDLSNTHGSVVAQHGDMVNMRYESNSLRYIVHNLLHNYDLYSHQPPRNINL